MTEFRIPTRIVYGQGSAALLASIGGQRLLLVYDNSGVADMAMEQLSLSPITVRRFKADNRYTCEAEVMEGAKALMEFKPDWILAAGGHGAMDLAKLIRIFYQRPELSMDDVLNGSAADIEISKTRLITLPLLNTNGGEAACTAHLADIVMGYESEVRCFGLIPDIAIIDPGTLIYSSERDEAQSVLSTLVLAIEASLDESTASFVRPMALEAMRIIFQSVLAHFSAPSQRHPLLYAQCLAGIACSNSSAGLSSTLARATALTFGTVSFGELAAVYLPSVIRLDKEQSRYLPAAEAMGLNDGASLASVVEEYADMLGLPLSLKEMGAARNAFLKKLSKIAHRVLSTASTGVLPEKEPQKIIEQILRSAYSPQEQQSTP